MVADDRWLGRIVFPSRAGTYLAYGAVWKHGYAVAVKRASVAPKLSIHDLRHTAATSWLAAGASVYFAKEQLGHTSVDPQAHAAAAARAAGWWREGTGTTDRYDEPVSALNTRYGAKATTGIEPV